MKSWLTALLDIIYPPKCPACAAPVVEHGAWCSKCLESIFAVRELSMPGHHLTYLDKCLAVCDYTGGIKRLLHDMKFRRADKFARHLTWILAQKSSFLAEEIKKADMVLPVPLHKDRLAERSYNQTALIFKPWSEKNGLYWLEKVLVRQRATLPQWELNLAERRKNIKGAFCITRPELIRGKRILLVDDIFTSGVTLDECAKQLKKAGAVHVTALVLASGAG